MYFKPCKHCGAPIAFYPTKTGKRVPIEQYVRQITVETCRPGQRPIKVIDYDGIIYTGGVIDIDDGSYPVVKGWVLHFGRCITDAKRKAHQRKMLEVTAQQERKEAPKPKVREVKRTSCQQLDLFERIM